MASTAQIVPDERTSSLVLKRTQHNPDKGEGCNADGNGTKMIGGISKLDRFVADIVGNGATNRRDEILPQMIARLALGALEKQHDQACKDNDRRPVVGRFHRVFLLIGAAFTTVVGKVANFTCQPRKMNLAAIASRHVATAAPLWPRDEATRDRL